jgi:hypothetical protein
MAEVRVLSATGVATALMSRAPMMAIAGIIVREGCRWARLNLSKGFGRRNNNNDRFLVAGN